MEKHNVINQNGSNREISPIRKKEKKKICKTQSLSVCLSAIEIKL